jgi:hypothetical protein
VELELAAGRQGDRLPGDVVLGRPQPPGRKHDVGPPEGRLQGRCHPAEVVAHRGLLEQIQAEGGQLAGNVGGVRVDNLAQEKLRADTHDLRTHGLPRHPSTPV